jgi:hypothetical protein
VKRGTFKGDPLSVDHFIPRPVVLELDNAIAKLELVPLRLEESKNAGVVERQVPLAKQLRKSRLRS